MLKNKFYISLTAFILLFQFFGGAFAPIKEVKSTPLQILADYPPRPPSDIAHPIWPLATPDETLALPPLKAVLLVGPIDGNDGSWTKSEINNMELAAKVLEANGVLVQRFYPGSDAFSDIETAAEGAHFLLYRGHGVYDGNLPSPNVGGFYLSSGFYSPELIRTNLHLAPNAIIMLYGCFTAGSSSAEGDNYDIGITEASRRVAQYSDPFFDIGAAGYYANWYGDAFEHFLSNLFAGQTLGQAYENFYDFNPSTVFRTVHPDHPTMVMWIDKDNWDYWQYNNAFAGKNNQTLTDLFKLTTLGGIPDNLEFTINVADQISIEPPMYTITPTNVTGDDPIEWSLTVNGNLLNVAPLQGISPSSSFNITPSGLDTTKPGKYTISITVRAITPQNTQNPIQSIQVNLNVYVPELGGLPDTVNFFYSIPDQAFLAESYLFTPANTGSALRLTWDITASDSWLNVSPANGQTPDSFNLSASGFDKNTVANYSGYITVTAMTTSVPVYRSPQKIIVNLEVSDKPISHLYLALVNNR